MTGGIPEHHLVKAAGKDGNLTVETDRPCKNCGYNLRGLPVNGMCPECGTAMQQRRLTDDSLSRMPPEVISRFVPGCWLCSISVIAAIAAYASRAVVRWEVGVVPGLLCLASVIWILGVWMITPEMEQPEAASRGFTQRSRLRAAARWMQLLWFAAALAMLAFEFAPSTNQLLRDVLHMFRIVFLLAGIAGIMVLSVLLGRLAEWVRDDVAERAFNWTAWGLPFVSLLLWGLLPFSGNRFGWALIVLWLICLGMFPWGLWSLSRSVTLSVVHSWENEDREERRKERQKEYDDEVAAQIDRIDAARRQKAVPDSRRKGRRKKQ